MSAAYREISFIIDPLEPGRDILIAELSQLPYDSFLETEEGLKAYIKEVDFNEKALSKLSVLKSAETKIEFRTTLIPVENWNANWEAQFEPILVDDQCFVRAPFHKAKEVAYDIEIMPKMSFGTGHHETTFLMIRQMLQFDFTKKRVLDMGCGTAVLAILACKMGADEVRAIDIDIWSFENAKENVERNGCSQIAVEQGDVGLLRGDDSYDVILANINRNVLISDIPDYARQLTKNGCLLLSGFYSEDLQKITGVCNKAGMHFENFLEKHNWVSAKYVF